MRVTILASTIPLLLAGVVAGSEMIPSASPCIAMGRASMQIATAPWQNPLHVSFTDDPEYATVRVQVVDTADMADFTVTDGAMTADPDSCAVTRDTAAGSISLTAVAVRSRIAAGSRCPMISMLVSDGDVGPILEPGLRPFLVTRQCTQKLQVQDPRVECQPAGGVVAPARALVRHEAGVPFAESPRTDLAGGDDEFGHPVAGPVVQLLGVAKGEILGVVGWI